MKKLLFIHVLSIFLSLSVSGDSVFTCEARLIDGSMVTLKKNVEEIIYPTIIIDESNDNLLLVYSRAGGFKSKSTYKIIKNDGKYIVGENTSGLGLGLGFSGIDSIYFAVDRKEFTAIYAGIGATLQFGNCQ
tara:strand:- start:351 stop:746 length:396 start_codon:yes stop_codon:yes gene_type:complete